MPILAEQPELFPNDVLSSDPADRLWWVVHTKPKQEKAIARDFLMNSVEYFLPCQKKRVKSKTGVVLSYIPLFSGYIFVRVTEAERIRVLATGRSAQMLSVADQPSLIRDLRGIRQIVDLGQPVTLASPLSPGVKVTLRDGPLMGLSGVVTKSLNGFRFMVTVNFIHQGASVEMPGEYLGVIKEIS